MSRPVSVVCTLQITLSHMGLEEDPYQYSLCFAYTVIFSLIYCFYLTKIKLTLSHVCLSCNTRRLIADLAIL